MRRFFTFCDRRNGCIMLSMQVYIELAVIENFCMDFTLLYCAKLAAKNPAHVLKVALGAALGAAAAVLIPLCSLKGAAAVAVKILSGFVICFAAGKFKNFKSYVVYSGVFLGFTAVLGGALIGIFSLAGLEYGEGGGYVISSIPVGIPLFGALCLIIFARKIAAKLRRGGRTEVRCRIYSGEKHIELSGFFDSGNKVYHGGCPVSVIPLTEAMKLVDESRIKDKVKIHTVAGSKYLKVFTADRIEILGGEKANVIKNIKIGISLRPSGGAVLHPDLMED